MRLAIGTTARERAWILPRWIESAAALEVPDGWEKAYALVVGDSQDDTVRIAGTAPSPYVFQIVKGPPYAERPAYSYEWLAKMRNDLMHLAFWPTPSWPSADALLIIDSDVMLEPSAGRKLLELDLPIVAPPVRTSENPACLNFLYYDGGGLYSRKLARKIQPGYPKRLDEPYFVVAAIGCCWLIRREVWMAGVRFEASDETRRGEEIGFAENARRRGFHLVVRPDIRTEHHMQRDAPPLVPVHLVGGAVLDPGQEESAGGTIPALGPGRET